MLFLTFKDTGEKVAVLGEAVVEFEARPTYKGNVPVQFSNGHIGQVARSEIRMVECIPDAEIKARQEAHEKQKAAEAAAAAEKERSAALQKARELVDGWNGLPWWLRVGKKTPANVIEGVRMINEARDALNTVPDPPAPAPAEKVQEPAK